MRVFLITILVAIAAGCANHGRKSAAIIPSGPAIGDAVRTTDARAESNTMIMAASSQFWPQYNLTVNGVDFVLGVNDEGIIRYISTEQLNFETPEGIRVGDSYQRVVERVGGRALAEPGWAFYVELPSGWRAAFVQGASMTEGELAKDTRVRWLFKR